MTTIFGHLGVGDSERGFLSRVGQTVVYDVVNAYVAQRNAELMGQIPLFVDKTTEGYKERFKLPSSGYMQEGNFTPSPSAGVRTSGYWDVAFPIDNTFDSLIFDYVSQAYMSPQELQYQIDGIVNRNANTMRHKMLKRLFNNVQGSFIDPFYGTLAIEPLANGDSVLYPPVIGSDTEATEDHYLESGYAASAISDTNNPLVTIHDDLVQHFGQNTGGENIVVLVNGAQVAKLRALADFTDVPYRFVTPGQDTAVTNGLPPVPATAVVQGYGYGVWVVQWDRIPANYMLGIHLEAPRPLVMRVDPADTGLARGLALVAQDERYPLQTSTWVNRYGFGVGNRLNGVVMELGTGGSYSIPAAFA